MRGCVPAVWHPNSCSPSAACRMAFHCPVPMPFAGESPSMATLIPSAPSGKPARLPITCRANIPPAKFPHNSSTKFNCFIICTRLDSGHADPAGLQRKPGAGMVTRRRSPQDFRPSGRPAAGQDRKPAISDPPRDHRRVGIARWKRTANASGMNGEPIHGIFASLYSIALQRDLAHSQNEICSMQHTGSDAERPPRRGPHLLA